MDIVERVLLLCLLWLFKKNNLATVSSLAGQGQWRTGISLLINNIHFCYLPSPIMDQAERAFPFVPQPPDGKLGEQDRLLSVEFHWLYGFLCRNNRASSRIPDNFDED